MKEIPSTEQGFVLTVNIYRFFLNVKTNELTVFVSYDFFLYYSVVAFPRA